MATCLPSGMATTQLIGPDSVGVRRVRRRPGEVEAPDEVDEDVRRTSQMSIVPLRLPARTWLPDPDQHA